MGRSLAWLVPFAALVVLATAPGARAAVAVKDGDRILFLGDSLTAFGMEPTGYVSLVIHGLKTAGVSAQPIGLGTPGATSKTLLGRLPRLIGRKPSWLLLNCGVNDVYFGARGVSLGAYRENVREIVRRAHEAGVRVMLVTPTLLTEDLNAPSNHTIEGYAAAVREIARAEQCLLADAQAEMRHELVELKHAGQQGEHLLTTFGAHLNVHGNMMMAATVLRAFGMDGATLARAREAWRGIPGADYVRVPLTVNQLDILRERALRQGTSVQSLLQPALERTVTDFLAR